VRSKNCEAQLHRKNPVGAHTLECFVTGIRNVFNLGFIPLKMGKTVILLCPEVGTRETPDQILSGLHLDFHLWQPIIFNRQIVSWLVPTPSVKDCIYARRVHPIQMRNLQKLWTKNETNYNTSPEIQWILDNVDDVTVRYENGYMYQNIFALLVKMEMSLHKFLKEEQRREKVTIRWEFTLNKKLVAFFIFPNCRNEFRLFLGDELRLRLHKPIQWVGSGRFIGLTDREEIKLEMKYDQTIPVFHETDFVVESVWKSICFERMQDALRTFAVDKTAVSGYIYNRLLGQDLSQKLFKPIIVNDIMNLPGLPELNKPQKSVILQILKQPLSLVQGPPGTGKTVVCAITVFYLLNMKHGQILVSAPSNTAVDQLAQKIDKTGVRIVRLEARENMDSTVNHLTLHHMVSSLITYSRRIFRIFKVVNGKKNDSISSDFSKYRKLKELKGELNYEDEKK
jgi:regulator of nonsense transcripts 1